MCHPVITCEPQYKSAELFHSGIELVLETLLRVLSLRLHITNSYC
jgi:hypothetical protein